VDNVDLGRALKAPFQEGWIPKSLLAIVWTFLIVTSPALVGAYLEYVKSVAHGDERLPDWSGFGEKWVKGISVIGAGLIYYAPAWLLSVIFIAPAAMSDGGTSDTLGAFAAGGLCLWNILILGYSLVMSLFYYAALTNYAMKGNFGAFFEIGEIWDRVRSTSSYWMAWLFALVVGLIYSIGGWVLGITVIGLLLIPAVYYLAGMSISHLFGQWARDAYAVVPAPPHGAMPPPPPPMPMQQPGPPAAMPGQPVAPPATPPAAPPQTPPAAPPQAPPAAPPQAPQPQAPPQPPPQDAPSTPPPAPPATPPSAPEPPSETQGQ
jgi:hypothetical protein